MKKIKNKKALLFSGALCLAFAAIAITIAYSMDKSVMPNTFEAGVYRTVTTEEFVGPDNWAPCQEVPKTVTVKNEGNIDVTVRISYEEYWQSSDGAQLSPELNGVHLATIVFQNESDWELSNGYYYYKHTLAPGESSNSLFKQVVLNCDADFGGESICTETATGTECVMPEPDGTICLFGSCTSDDYRSAKYHLSIKVETIQADKVNVWSSIGYAVDQIQGLTQRSEKGKTVSMFTTQADGNNVIWSNFCWKIVRTTYTGGIKMIYAGVPTIEDGAQVCSSPGSGITVSGSSTAAFDTSGKSGYMHGDTISTQSITLDENDTTTSFVLSNSVSRNGNTYTLDTSAGQFIEGVGVDLTPEAQTRYHYFCTDGSSVCDSSKIGYLTKIVNANYSDPDANPFVVILDGGGSTRRLVYYPLGGYDDVDDLKDALFDNKYDSSAKTTIESWFEANNLDDDALEDAIYCSDRSIASGSLAGPEANLGKTVFASANREDNPTLDCANKKDAFTKDDTVNGNGKLSHKVGLLTADEMAITGLRLVGDENTTAVINCAMGRRNSFLWTFSKLWSMTPTSGSGVAASYNQCTSQPSNAANSSTNALYPVVTLKGEATLVSGSGLESDPYIVE